MPYIEPDRRKLMAPELSPLIRLIELGGFTEGDINYIITKVALAYLHTVGESYPTLSNVAKIFRDAEHEFRRRKIDPYEDGKRDKNGDVYF